MRSRCAGGCPLGGGVPARPATVPRHSAGPRPGRRPRGPRSGGEAPLGALSVTVRSRARPRGLRLPATRATHAASGAARRLPEAGGSACGDSVDPCPRHGGRAEARGERRTPAPPRQGDAPRTPGRAARRMAAPLRPDRGPRAGRGLARCPDRSGDRPAGSDTRRPPLGDRGGGHRGPRGADAPADGPSPLTSRHVSRGHEACGAAPDAAEPTHTHGRQGPPRHPHPREGAGARKGGTPTGPQHTSRGAKPAPRAPLAQPR